jgi:prepilin-type N-terminal cleavage/methylation domain-containing protein
MFIDSMDCAQFCGRILWAHRRTRPTAIRKRLGTAERHLGSCPYRATCQGFSLVELLASMAILLVVSGGMLSAISLSQQSYARTEMKSDMYENVRGVAELMTQEIGQAGLVSLPKSTIAAVAKGVQTPVVTQSGASSAASMFVGEQVLVDAGNLKEELVTLTAVTATTITATFANAHLAATPINVLGVFPSGIVPTTAGPTSPSTANILNIVGDINSDGSLVYVRYVCTPGTTAAPGTLTRSVTTITPGVNTTSANQTLLTTVVGGVGAACFQYIQPAAVTVGATAYTFVTNVGFTLSVQATRVDPQTGVYPTMTKSFLNLAPRNVLAGYELASASPQVANRIQATPPNVAVYP